MAWVWVLVVLLCIVGIGSWIVVVAWEIYCVVTVCISLVAMIRDWAKAALDDLLPFDCRSFSKPKK